MPRMRSFDPSASTSTTRSRVSARRLRSESVRWRWPDRCRRCSTSATPTGTRSWSSSPADSSLDSVGAMFFDAVERAELCDLLDELGPDAPTLLDGWTTRDLAAHLVLRE